LWQYGTANCKLLVPAHEATEDTEDDKNPASNDENEGEPIEAPIACLVKGRVIDLLKMLIILHTS
jgi:hypothetical protein